MDCERVTGSSGSIRVTGSGSFQFHPIQSRPSKAPGRASDSSNASSTSERVTAPESRRPYLLDTSALMAFIEGEEGADRVEQVLRGEDVF